MSNHSVAFHLRGDTDANIIRTIRAYPVRWRDLPERGAVAFDHLATSPTWQVSAGGVAVERRDSGVLGTRGQRVDRRPR